ncbi:MAG: tetratricopeptide repeat protein [Candidatus Aminicenantales bacterium]
MKRRERRQLKEDEFVTTINRLVLFFKRRKRELTAFSLVAVLVVISIVISSLVRAQNVKKESRLVAEIFEIRSQLDENPDKVAELENITGRKNYSRLANIVLASYWVERGEFQKAEQALEKLERAKKDVIYYQAQDLLALVQMEKGDYERAIEIYTRIEKENPKSYILDGVLFHHAQALERKGEKEEALSLYRRIQAEFSQTAFGFEASQKVSELEGK